MNDMSITRVRADAIPPTSAPPARHAKAADIPEHSLRDMRRNLFLRILDCMETGETALADHTMFLDISAYRDPEQFEQEFKLLFREMPQVACLSTDIPESGSFYCFDDLGVPIVVMRGKDGVVRAFLNICTHRGARCGGARG